MKLLRAAVLILLAAVMTTAQAPQSSPKPTEQVVGQYEELVSRGALLTPTGWKAASRFFYESQAFPHNGTIFLTSSATAAMIGEMWVKGDRADVQTKWTDYFGSIDSSLRYKPESRPAAVVMTVYDFHMIYTNKHRDMAASGAVTETTGPWEWKLEEPQKVRWTTVARALEYLTRARDTSDDPVIRENAEKTIAALKHLHVGCGTASAC
jgi:hypothetical protein